MAEINIESTLNSLHQEIFADTYKNLVPNDIILLKKIKFAEPDAVGEKYTQPVQTTQEFGFSIGTGAYALNAAIAAEYPEAQVNPVSMMLRSKVGYDAADRMTSSKKAFVKWGDLLYGGMQESMWRRMEILALYGGSSIGQVASIAAGVITITAASWAPGIWGGTKGMIIEAFSALTGGSQRNGDLTVSVADIDNRQITVTGTSAAIVANDYLFFKGFRGSEFSGIEKICTNDGTLFNISAATYPDTWKGSTYSAGTAALTMAKILSAAAKGVNKGCRDDYLCMVSNDAWANMNADQAALTVYEGTKSKAENGFDSLVFKGQNGKIEVIGSSICKGGDGFLIPVKRMKGISSLGVDVMSFNRPSSGDKIWLDIPDIAGFELRLRSSIAVFCEMPAYLVKISNIVST